MLEIGCGIGTALHVAAKDGKRVAGYDIDSAAIEKGWELFNIPLFDEIWTSTTSQEAFDLVLSIHVLEHFMKPLPMIHELATYCQRHKSLLFASVPFFTPSQLFSLHTADPRDEKSILRVPVGHYTLFSPQGLQKAFDKYGCKSFFMFTAGTWGGFLCDFGSYSA